MRWIRSAMLFGAGALLLFGCTRGTYTETECPSNDPRIIALYKANNRLNKAIVHHEWKTIYGWLERGYMAGATRKPVSYEDFQREVGENFYSEVIFSLRMISYETCMDSAELATIFRPD